MFNSVVTMERKTKNMVASALIAGSLAGNSLAQSNYLEGNRESFNNFQSILDSSSLEQKFAISRQGLFSQTLLSYDGNNSVKFMANVEPDVNKFGLRIDGKNTGLEFNYNDLEKDNFGGVVRLYSEDKEFMLGGFFESLDENIAGLIARHRVNDNLRLEATANTKGVMRAVLMPHWDGSCIGVGVGVNETQDFVGNIALNNHIYRVAFMFGDRPFDARFVIGDHKPRASHVFSSVDNSGINEIRNLEDNTFQFGIGQNPRFEFYEEFSALGSEPGDLAFYTRYIEDNKVYGNLALRLGDIGLDNSAVAIGLYRNLSDEFNGVTGEFRFGSKNYEVGVKADVNERDSKLGFFAGVNF